MNLKRILSTALLAAVCILPVSAFAQEIGPIKSYSEFTLDLMQPQNKNGENTGEYYGKFTDTQPAADIAVAPIENVEDYLPEVIYPKAIKTSELLSLVNPRTDTFKVIDIETGKSFDAVRYGGNKHLDTEPKTKEDTQILNSLENQSWNRRAIAVYINGEFYAASMHTMDHGNGFVNGNDFNGHICIHVLESRTHGGNRVCPQHQAMVNKALNTDITDTAMAIKAGN